MTGLQKTSDGVWRIAHELSVRRYRLKSPSMGSDVLSDCPHILMRVRAKQVAAPQCNQLIRKYFSLRIDLHGCAQSEPKRGSIPFELALANVISFDDL